MSNKWRGRRKRQARDVFLSLLSTFVVFFTIKTRERNRKCQAYTSTEFSEDPLYTQKAATFIKGKNIESRQRVKRL